MFGNPSARNPNVSIVDSRSLRCTCSGKALALPGDGGRRVDPKGTMAGTNLTARERQILELIGTGRSTKEIARALKISTWTVASHRKGICAKLGVHTTAELVAHSSAESTAGAFTAGRSTDRCHLTVELGTRKGRLLLTYSGRLRRMPGAVTVRIGRNVFYF